MMEASPEDSVVRRNPPVCLKVSSRSPMGSDDRKIHGKLAPLVIREPTTEMTVKKSPVIEKGKGVDVASPLPSFDSVTENDQDASSSVGLKLFVNRFGNAISESTEKNAALVKPSDVRDNVQEKSTNGILNVVKEAGNPWLKSRILR
ncbi:hypothetical protein MA16_Dca001109 [Dendrobium catenatum]|uniref:Uncharacterized protein n=1 Tax=Dendrobium catenatum TaxID=906689 RepID=A0A2I0WLH4_9ASPA|nr:hypothetical protein MA16_Dca001109 [Dendrobium catenatum]